jgi:hypothetical protein
VTRLRELARRTPVAMDGEALEHCDLCDAPLDADHRHVLDLASREIACACRPCALLFDRRGAGGRRLLPERRLQLVDFELDDPLWEELRIPVDMAFFFSSSAAGRVVAYYPGPMGATESLLGLEAWEALAAANPVLGEMEPDVEALLVNRARGARGHWLVPLDECYRLVAVIRTGWKGLTGGREVWEEIGRFFAELDRRSKEMRWDRSSSASAR